MSTKSATAATATASSGSSAPLVSIIAGIYAYCTVNTFSTAGFVGVLAAGGVGIATGIATGIFAGIGAIGGLVVVGGAAAVVGAAVKKPGVFAAAGAALGMIAGGLTGGIVGMVKTYGFTKDVAIDLVEKHQASQEAAPSAIAADRGTLSVTANKQFENAPQAPTAKPAPAPSASMRLSM